MERRLCPGGRAVDGGETPWRMPQQQVRDRRSLRVSQKTVDWVLFPHRLLV
jgi:hypothetical protein